MTAIGVLLSGTNLWGYYKCSKGIHYTFKNLDQQKQMRQVHNYLAKKGISYALRSWPINSTFYPIIILIKNEPRD